MSTKEKIKFELIDGKHQKWGSGVIFDSVEDAQKAADEGRKYNMCLHWIYVSAEISQDGNEHWAGTNVKEYWAIRKLTP